jgi:hypothetical protein
VKFSSIYNKCIVFIPSHLSNYREFISHEAEIATPNEVKKQYTSSVHLTPNNVEVKLSLNKDFTAPLQANIFYDVHVSFVKMVDHTNIFKILKITLSLENVKEDDSDSILEDYEICQLFENTAQDVKSKIHNKQKDLDELIFKIDNLGKTIENMNLLTDINEYLMGPCIHDKNDNM